MILSEGRNCWRIARADRAAFLVDAAAYFASFREAVLRARHSVIILGWDVDSRVRLSPGAGPPPDGAPAELLPFLNHVLERRRDLRVYVLGWDYYVIYAFEREPLPTYRFAWKGNSRLHFQLDAAHPVGGSHHQKVVVIDDRVAFTGGLDLTIRRWDTPEHRASHPDRVDLAGEPYPPMHDVQMVVDGDAASALGELARARWLAATGLSLPAAEALAAAVATAAAVEAPPAAPAEEDPDPWPPGVTPDLRDVALGIARTLPPLPGSPGSPGVQEIQALTLDAIAAARRWIYIENQYLTSAVIGQALARRLAEPDGPEVVAVLPREECGWLERRSMGIMRARLLARLLQADRFGRLRVCYPTVPGLAAGCLNVHSKVMIADDALALVGSPNLSNRSMGLDSECDLAIDAGLDPRLGADIAGLRNRLLAEHLGTTPGSVGELLSAHGSLIGAIDALRGGPRSLEPLPPPDEVGAAATASGAGGGLAVNLALMDGLVCDPEKPADDQLMEQLVTGELRHPVRRSLLGWGVAIGALALVAALWRLSPLRALLDVERAVALGRTLQAQPAAPLWVLGGYLVGSLVFFPVTLMLAATALVFDPARAFAYSMAGALSGAALTYGIGQAVHRVRGDWLNGPRLSRMRRQLQRRGVVAVVAARMLPVGNFSLINMLAGALGIRFRDYMLGNVLGLLPGILGLTLFASRLGNTLRNPQPRNLLVLAALVAVIVGALSWLRRRLARATQHAPRRDG